MTQKLKNYEVLAVENNGSSYKVKHKVTNEIFSWRAMNCNSYADEQIQNIVNEVKTIVEIKDCNILKYFETILHTPSKTIYFVVEYNSFQSLKEVAIGSKSAGKRIKEEYIWYILHELANVSKSVYNLKLGQFKRRLSIDRVYLDPSIGIKVDCFEVSATCEKEWAVLPEIGKIISDLCHIDLSDKLELLVNNVEYSTDLQSIITFLLDDKNMLLNPNVLLLHPTILANFEPFNIENESFYAEKDTPQDKENIYSTTDSFSESQRFETTNFQVKAIDELVPLYENISPKKRKSSSSEDWNLSATVLSPTLAALALELPGFVPKRPIRNRAIAKYKEPQQVSEETLSKEWMSRLIALREREESLNRRERQLITKEIVNSPGVMISIHRNSETNLEEKSISLQNLEAPNSFSSQNGITLQSIMSHKALSINDKMENEPDEDMSKCLVPRRYHRRSSSVRSRNKRRKSYCYEDLDSSLSADPGDGSVIVTSRKFDKENLPSKKVFSVTSNKKVHFTHVNPFTENDEGVTLTFYELENIDCEGYQVPRHEEYTKKELATEIAKFKYLDLEKITNNRRTTMATENSELASPNKGSLIGGENKVFMDITNSYLNEKSTLTKVPSKASLTSKTSNVTGYSTASSQCSQDSDKSKMSFQSCSSRKSMAKQENISSSKPFTRQKAKEPIAPATVEKKTKSRRSLLSFKTPFKLR